MIFRTAALIASLAAVSGQSLAQPAEASSDSDLTLEQWQRRVEGARHRSEDYVARLRTQPPDLDAIERQEREANDRRAMTDPTLRRGDIVSTSKGFLVFIGRDDADRNEDLSSGNFRQTEQLR